MAAVVVTVDYPSDARLSDYTGLTDVELRRQREPAEGLFIAEGEKVIRRAVAAGYPVRSMLLAQRWLDGLDDLLQRLTAPVFVAPDEVLAAVTGYAVHRGALAALARRRLPSVAEVVAPARTVVVLEDVNDHTNVGLVFRSAAALGIDAAVLAPRCADPLYRRALKTSMGAVFVLPYAHDVLVRRAHRAARRRFRDASAHPGPGGPFARRGARWHRREGRSAPRWRGQGLSTRWRHSADAGARIPMAPGVDSLNVAAAAAVAFYVLRRRLRPDGP